MSNLQASIKRLPANKNKISISNLLQQSGMSTSFEKVSEIIKTPLSTDQGQNESMKNPNAAKVGDIIKVEEAKAVMIDKQKILTSDDQAS